jgi:hypothetical protein
MAPDATALHPAGLPLEPLTDLLACAAPKKSNVKARAHGWFDEGMWVWSACAATRARSAITAQLHPHPARAGTRHAATGLTRQPAQRVARLWRLPAAEVHLGTGLVRRRARLAAPTARALAALSTHARTLGRSGECCTRSRGRARPLSCGPRNCSG